MKKTTIFLFTLLLSNLILGQQTKTGSELNESKTKISIATENQNPQIVIVIDSKSYRIDNLKEMNIDPNWIESVSVLKNKIFRKIYGNKNGAILIYIKKEFGKKVLKKIEKEKTAPNSK